MNRDGAIVETGPHRAKVRLPVTNEKETIKDDTERWIAVTSDIPRHIRKQMREVIRSNPHVSQTTKKQYNMRELDLSF